MHLKENTRIFKLNQLILILLTAIACYACQSQGTRVRNEYHYTCRDLQIPEDAKASKKDLLQYKNQSYVLSERYISLATHAMNLSECIRISQCLIEILEYERDCEIEKRNLSWIFLGISKRCSQKKPNC